VGSGAAGIATALAAAQRGRDVLLISKDDLDGGATPLAQGGLAAALGPGDTPARHRADTLTAGAGLCDPDAVSTLVREVPAEINRLTRLGARLDTTSLHREGGHHRSRIVHAGGDAIGAEVHRVLRTALRASPVRILTHCVALDALTSDNGPISGSVGGSVGGVLAGVIDPGGTLRAGTITARAVVLATGGFGQAYATTSSPAGVTGDGLALAARAGAAVQDVEFVQFHPTVLWQAGAQGQCPLITEALRGAGAVLVDQAGRTVMTGRHPLGDLAPRDVVAAVMQEALENQAATGGSDHVWLDATGLRRDVLERNFPTVLGLCRARGVDPVTEPIPVAPGAHYSCGGVRADMTGRTSLPGLFAVGEVASTGVHGANRLASNSVTEALITGRRAGERLGAELPPAAGPLRRPDPGTGVARGVDPAARPALAVAMSRYAGVLRDRDGLERLLGQLEQAPAAAVDPGPARLDLATVEATNLHLASVLLTVAALARGESRGCHRWHAANAIAQAETARHSVLRLGPELTVSARPVLTEQAEQGAA
jgi:L-aspartate oxidase